MYSKTSSINCWSTRLYTDRWANAQGESITGTLFYRKTCEEQAEESLQMFEICKTLIAND